MLTRSCLLLASLLTSTFHLLPVAAQQAPRFKGAGLQGIYYRGQQFEEPVFARTDAALQFNWQFRSPGDGLEANNFSVRWTGALQAPETGAYTFVIQTDDGMRVWLGNQLLFDEWRNQPPATFTATVQLQAGRVYPLRVEYYQANFETRARLFWRLPSASRKRRGLKPIPATAYVPPADTLANPRAPLPALSRLAAVTPKVANAQPLPPAPPTVRAVSLPPRPRIRRPAPRPVPRPAPVVAAKPSPRRLFAPQSSPVRPPQPVALPAVVRRPPPAPVTARVVRAPARPARVRRPKPPRPAVRPIATTPKAAPAAPAATLTNLGQLAKGTTLALPNLYFEQGKPRLLTTAGATVEQLARILLEQPTIRLAIAGHTDNVGDPALNQRLSEQRAQLIRQLLIDRGIDSARLSAVGYGGTRPVADNADPRQRPRNRRVEITVR